MQDLTRDLRFGLRTLTRSPGFTLLVVVTLALGIATNVAIFATVHGMLLDSLPYREPDRLAFLWASKPSQGWGNVSISAANFRDWQQRSRTFESMAIWDYAGFNLSTGDEVERVGGVRTSPNLFQVVGIEPALGRGFGDADAAREEPVVVLSHALWQQRFGADPDALGRKILLDGAPHTVIGVMAAQQEFPLDTQLWLPHDFREEAENRSNRGYAAVGPPRGREGSRRRGRRALGHRRRPGHRVPGGERGLERDADATSRRVLRSGDPHRLHGAHDRRRLRGADRLRQHRQPASRPGRRPGEGDVAPRRSRSRSRSGVATAAVGEPPSRSAGRRPRARAHTTLHPRPPRDRAGRHAATGQHRHELAGAGLHPRPHPGDGTGLRPGAGAPGIEARPQRLAQGRRAAGLGGAPPTVSYGAWWRRRWPWPSP